MNDNKLPTITGVFILAGGTLLGLILVNNKQIFKLKASEEGKISNFQVSNITDNSANISFIYSLKTECFVRWGEKDNQLENTAIRQNQSESYSQYFAMNGLKPSQKYFLRTYCEKNEYSDANKSWSFRTGSKTLITSDPLFVSGVVLDNKSQPAENTLVYITTEGGKTLSSLTTKTGSWLIDVSKTYNSTLSKYMDINPLTVFYVNAEQSPKSNAFVTIQLSLINKIPPVKLGNNYNYKNEGALMGSENKVPESFIFLPE